MRNAQLCYPDTRYESSVLDAIAEFKSENSASIAWYYRIDGTFDNYVTDLLNRKNFRTETIVPESILWAIKDDQFVGRISIRHELNDNLRKLGGHIGYEVRPSYRRQGIASEMLRLALPLAQELGLQDVLLTCDDDNVASIKTIEKNGGLFDKKVEAGAGKPHKRHYWISTK